MPLLLTTFRYDDFGGMDVEHEKGFMKRTVAKNHCPHLSHLVHSLLPLTPAYLPTSHAVQLSARLLDDFPTLQTVQLTDRTACVRDSKDPSPKVE